jgi:formylglycine-generating enzyme required for sulfatase activity
VIPIGIGTRLGRYEIRAKLGAGGMGEVFLADDTQLGRHVALKFLPAATASDEHARRRLMREARAAATLDHPHICSVFEVGEAEGLLFIAMRYVEGETLAARLGRGSLDLRETLAIAIQIVDALGEAHARGVLHRDLKPANVMLSSRGDAVVLDFGLAKPAEPSPAEETGTISVLTTPGALIGTVPYMSPEQVRGEALDLRSDLFSAGVMLYEMVSGRRPFDDSSSIATAAAILTREPVSPVTFAPDTPAELERIILKLLRKDPNERYQTAKDLLIDLRALREEQAFQVRLQRTPTPHLGPAETNTQTLAPIGPVATAPKGRSWLIAMSIVTLVAVGAGGWFAWRSAQVRRARAELPEIVRLAQDKRYFEAYDRAIAIERDLPGDATLAGLMPAISDVLSVTTEPAGASVYLRRYSPDPSGASPPRQHVGTTPLTNVRIARGQYVLSLEKEGFARVERTISGIGLQVGDTVLTLPPASVSHPLVAADSAPAGMVFVPGGDYRLVAWSRPTDRRVPLGDFFIGKYEISNREFKEFITAGGYLKREYWQHPIVKDGVTIDWAGAMRVFVDRTGLSGPREWSNQNPPEGQDDHPVTGVSWYEAAAYAAFRGQSLPTVFQWEKAARNAARPSAGFNVMPWGPLPPGAPLLHRANFGAGTMPVSSNEFGMSAFGAYNMAGNVAEWTLNDSPEGFIATGASWGDPLYMFAQFGGRPGLFSSNKLGFRLVRNTPGTGDQGSARLELESEIPVYSVSSPETFRTVAATYPFEPRPLDARIEETVKTPDWTRDKISFNADGERTTAYLYLPHHVARPVQVLHYLPASDVDGGFRSLSASMDDRMAPFIKSGRAAFAVVLKGYAERLHPSRSVPVDFTSVEFHDRLLNRITDLRCGLEYLASRDDVDRSRWAMFAPSAGATFGLIFASVENRYRAIVMVGAGVSANLRRARPETNPLNFAPHIRTPKLIVQGRYDENTPLRSEAEPLFKVLSQPKTLYLFDGGHIPTNDILMKATAGWLDEMLGPVRY